ncbi:MAG TPA: GntR family transcriptional regulator [Castellaniella sp.]|uniref:GntR family transcriptional regulator n=1 Tax=Castellaniella sp. TaxID=1955812 RepID=UPI002F054CCE
MKPRDLSAPDIAQKLYSAILEHRIPPGTKLAEGRLATIFSVNRARIREVLARLAHEQVVELVPHQGAHVAKPTVEDAKSVFEARRLVEPFTVRKLTTTLTADKTALLRRHLAKEEEARRLDDQPSIIRLSGEFHVLLADLAGNTALLRTTRELSMQTCLIISLYSHSTALSCRADEHETIAQAVIDKEAEQAVHLILEHFDHIQGSLELNALQEDIDLEGLFAEN